MTDFSTLFPGLMPQASGLGGLAPQYGPVNPQGPIDPLTGAPLQMALARQGQLAQSGLAPSPPQAAPPPAAPRASFSPQPTQQPQGVNVFNTPTGRMLLQEQARISGLEGAAQSKFQGFQDTSSALKDLLSNTAGRIRSFPLGPTQAQRWGDVAAAFGTPTRTGNLGETMGNVGAASARDLAAQRQADWEKEQLAAKYELEGGQVGLQAQSMGIQGILSQLNNANTRASTLAIATGNQASKPATVDPNGNVIANTPAIAAHGLMTGVEAAARMHAQMAGFSEGPAQDQMMQQAMRIAAYKAPPLPPPRMGSPAAIAYYNAMNGMVYSLNADYDAKNYPAAVKALSSFRGGKDGTTLDAANTSIQHLSLLGNLYDALQNPSDIQALNYARNAFLKAFGRAAPTNVSLVQNIAAAEVNKIATGGPGAEPDRELMRAGLDMLKMPPEQARGAIDNSINLMAGRVYSMRQRFKAATKMTDNDFDAQLTPETRAQMEKHGGGASGQPSAETAPGTGQTVTKANVEAYATQHKLTYDDALKHVQGAGYTVQ